MTNQCVQCGELVPAEDVVVISRRWVSWGKARPYTNPVTKPCHVACRDKFLGERAKYFAVLDETMNTCKFWTRIKGQDGVYDNGTIRVECEGWRWASEVGVPYEPSERYAAYW